MLKYVTHFYIIERIIFDFVIFVILLSIIFLLKHK